MKFRYYITDLGDGLVKGTNDDTAANQLAESNDHFVVDSETGDWLNPDGRDPIEEL